jgi:multiple sugar transport system permease protein
VDGASALQRFRWITLPSLMPVLGVTVVLVMLWVFRDFSIIKVLTGGGPLKTTQTLSIMTYDQAFGFFKFGYASAVGVVTLVICVVASLAMLGRQSKAMY